MRKTVLKPVCEGNVLDIFALQLEERQKIYVSHPMRSLALGCVYGEHCHPFGIYDGETLVGYVMLRFDHDKNSCTLWHFMIDRLQQGRGYGKSALQEALDYIRIMSGGLERVLLTCHPENEAALELYRSAGFRETGRTEGVEIELELPLK